MAMARFVAALVVTVLLASCAVDENGFDGTTLPIRPEPSDPVTGLAVRTLMVGETRFSLHDEGGGCVALNIEHPGLQTTVERRCFEGERVLAVNSDCGWLATSEHTSPEGCDVTLPIVFYGQVRSPDIGYVCIGTIRQPTSAVESARFVSLDDAGYVLDAAMQDEGPVPHLFTPGGIRYGFPPLDAPSNPIYTFCEAQAPWGTTEYSLPIGLYVFVGDALRSDDVLIFVDTGTGPVGMSGAAGGEENSVNLSLVVAASSSELDITIQWSDGTVSFIRDWPENFQAILDQGQCHWSVDLRLSIRDPALMGYEDAVDLSVYQNPFC